MKLASFPRCCHSSRHTRPRILTLSIAALLATITLGAGPAFGNGGAGGNGSANFGGGPGGAGGTDGVNGSNGGDGNGSDPGGGGGGGGGAGALGGSGGNGSNSGGAGGAPETAGSDTSNFHAGGGGGGGGNGGANGQTITVPTTISAAVTGTAGNAGAAGGSATGTGFDGGGGGGGGAGGNGVLVTGATAITNNSTVTGGNGGAAGNGGNGTNSNGFGGNGGSGGGGGNGFTFNTSGATLTNTGTITGGNGGAPGSGGAGSQLGHTGANGAGGVGVAGSGLTIINSGTISGGMSADGVTRANAITFSGTGNTLEIQSGSTITGNVIGTGADTFRLGGATNSTFDLGTMGPAGQYRGFATLVKTGTSTWTVLNSTGANAYTGPTLVQAGTLKLGAADALPTATDVVFGTPNAATAGLLDLAGNNQTVKSLNVATGNTGGIANSIFSSAGAATLTVSSTTTNSAFGGLLADGGGTLALVKAGAGTTLNLTGANTYSGGTTVNGGTLLVNNTTGSATGSGPVTVNTGGTLGGNGFISGLVRNAGTVSPGNSPGTLTIGGNYTQTSSGILKIEIAGLSPGQFDLLKVGGHATLGGTLQIVPLKGANLFRGETITFLTAGQGISGTFATVVDPYINSTILEPTLIYGANSVSVELSQGSFEALARFDGLSANQISVARALDSIALNRKASALIGYLNTRDISKLPGDFEKIDPSQLTSMFTIGTALATVQSLNIQRRTDDIRSGSSGFNAAGLALNGAGPSYSGGFGLSTGVAGPTGKDVKESVPVADWKPENKWGAFLSGTGEWVSVGDTDNARGYDLTSGGFTLGLDYKVTPNLAVGLAAGYTGTSADLTDRGRVYVNGGKLGLYATYFQTKEVVSAPTMSKDSSKDSSKETPAGVLIAQGLYADLAVFGGYNSYDTRRSGLLGEARGDTDGGELNVLFGTGYDFKKGGLTFGPTATFNYTYLGTSDYTEHGSLAPLDIHGGKGESLRTAFGFKASYDWKVGSVLIKPEIRAAWQHEYGDAAYDLSSNFASGGGSAFLVNGPEIGRDSVLLGGGFAIQFSERCSTYFYYDGELGRRNYQSTNVTGGLRIAF